MNVTDFFLAGCYGGRYQISAIICGEGTVDACPDGNAIADGCARSYALLVCTHVNAHSGTSIHTASR